MVQHLGEKTCSIGASRKTEEVDIISRRVVSHQELCILATNAKCLESVLEFLHDVERAKTRGISLCIQP
jgi:hypothetical protein